MMQEKSPLNPEYQELWRTWLLKSRLSFNRAGRPEVAVNSLKNKRSGQQTPAANIKKPRKGDVNFCPNIPSGETRDSLEVERVALLTEVKKKKKDKAVIKEKMQHTFSLRRQEILQEPKIPEFLNKWPALFDVSEINLEFMRLTTVPLTSKFLGELDRLTDDLIRVFHTKDGAAGRMIRAVMAKTHNSEDINVRRDCVLSCLSIYLNEDLDTLVKEYVEVNPHGPEEPEVKGQVLEPKHVLYASDDSSAPNKKDSCCGQSAYELKCLENIREREAFLSSLKFLTVSGHVDWNSNQHKTDQLVSLSPSLYPITLCPSPPTLSFLSLPLPLSLSYLCPAFSPSPWSSPSLCLPHTSHIWFYCVLPPTTV
uniref:Uncharacterized protein n=2 Tax=Dicentrarchus labrax TaxID=13489 RepID=A0A8P4KSQ0_DICLA